MQIGEFESLPVGITLDQESRLYIKAPARMIAETDPASDPAPIVQHEEERTIGLREQVETISYEVRSSIFRNEVLTPITDATVWTPFKWLLLLLVSATSDELSAALGGRLRRITGRHTPTPPGSQQPRADDAPPALADDP